MNPHFKPATSLRRILLLWLIAPLVVVVPASAVLQYVLTIRPAHQAFDMALGDSVIGLSNFLKLQDGAAQFEISPQVERYFRTDQFDTVYFAVLDGNATLIAGDQALKPAAAPLGDGQWYFVDAAIGEQAVRIAARGIPCGPAICQILVGETLNKRSVLARDVLIGTAITVLALLAIAALVVVLASRRALRPLSRISDQVTQRSLDDLRPLDTAAAPRETQPLLSAVNRLFERLTQAAQAQRAFLADAAHQLRTPLTTLRTESELALRETDPAAQRNNLQRLNTAALRAARLAEQLLTLARADPQAQAAIASAPLNLRLIAHELAQEWVPRALARETDLGFELSDAPVVGRAVLLSELLANLLDNAIEYAGHGAVITVRTYRRDQQVILEVQDNGPGIAIEDRERVWQRFFRADTASRTSRSGSGLGLAIVREIAAQHQASTELLVPPQGSGTLIRLCFPAASGA